MLDLIIIGMGISGITAGIYAKRGNLKVLCLEEKMIGGTINFIDRIDNYPGLPNINGASFVYTLMDQLKELEVPYKEEKVLKVEKESNGFIVTTTKEKYITKKVLIATGRIPKKLGIKKEEEFLGRGISYCAVCDGAFFKNKCVAVLGGGDSALSEALYLSNLASKVYLIHHRDSFRASKSLVEKVMQNNKIEILYKDEIIDILGDTQLSGVVLKSGKTLEVFGLFIYIGYVPGSSYLSDFPLFNDKGYIAVNDEFETNVEGIYAVGDIIEKKYYQIITSASDGATAALNIMNKLEKRD